MTVVSSKEFVTSPAKYFNRAINEQVMIKRGRNMFHLINANASIEEDEEDDNDVYITKDELLKGIHEDLEIFFANK